MKLNNDFLDRFDALGGDNMPPSRKLSMLIRPAMIAAPGCVLVWQDWAAIEARVLPWLAGSRGSEKVLQVFRDSDHDPSLPDIYMREASNTFNVPAEEIMKGCKEGDPEAIQMRGVGKVETLSMGFGGSLGALLAMAANYRIHIDPVWGAELVQLWRSNNAWARAFWGSHGGGDSYGLWGAVCSCINDPDTVHAAGRLGFVFDKRYLGGTMFMLRPSGGRLTYPRIKWETREVEDRVTKKLVERTQLTFDKGYGRSALWYGKVAENATQAEAGAILRGTLVKVEYGIGADGDPYSDWMPCVGHTHDEIVVQADEADAGAAEDTLHELLVEGFEWSEGLPLEADGGSNWYYTKAKV